jgi:hypothetical protein
VKKVKSLSNLDCMMLTAESRLKSRPSLSGSGPMLSIGHFDTSSMDCGVQLVRNEKVNWERGKASNPCLVNPAMTQVVFQSVP